MSPGPASFDGRMLRVAALWNWAIALAFVLFEAPLRDMMQLTAARDPVVSHLFYALVVALGIGYFVASQAPRENRGILWAGIVAKILAFLLMGGHVLTGHAGLSAMGAPVVDFIFAILFIRCLCR
jgi:hypothetical protein